MCRIDRSICMISSVNGGRKKKRGWVGGGAMYRTALDLGGVVG